MIESEVIVTTQYGKMPTFAVCPEGPGISFPGIIFYMNAPGIREELRNMARRIAKHGYFCLLPDMYYRLGTCRFDVSRRDDGMMGVIRAAMNHLTNAPSSTTPPHCSPISTGRTRSNRARSAVLGTA
jgi:carboxymethylenebutenolidase